MFDVIWIVCQSRSHRWFFFVVVEKVFVHIYILVLSV